MATISQVNINDLSYDFIDIKSRNILTEFYDVDKIVLDARDYSSGSSDSAIDIYPPNASFSTKKLIGIADGDEKIRSYMDWVDFTYLPTFRLCTDRNVSSSMGMSNYLSLGFNGNNPRIDVQSVSRQAWRRALGFHDDVNTTTISEIITPGSGITIVDAHYIERFNVAMLYLHFKYNQAISVPNHGNIADVTVGTLVEGKRPCHMPEVCSNGDEGGAAWYHITTATGVISLSAIEGISTTRTIAANTQFNLASTYLVR